MDEKDRRAVSRPGSGAVGAVRLGLHLDVLEGAALEVLKHVASQAWADEFYLAGGTALALQLGHRISIDLDFFSRTNSLGRSQREQIIESVLKEYGTVQFQEDRTLKLNVEGVSVSLFHYPDLLVAPLLQVSDFPALAAKEDIGLMKLAAIIGRGCKRDFIDLYFICQEIELSRLLKLSKDKYPKVGDFGVQALRALTYFTDADGEGQPRMLLPLDWTAVKEFFSAKTQDLSRKWYDLD